MGDSNLPAIGQIYTEGIPRRAASSAEVDAGVITKCLLPYPLLIEIFTMSTAFIYTQIRISLSALTGLLTGLK